MTSSGETFRPLSWKEIASHITDSEEGDSSITAQGCCDLHKRMLRRLKNELLNDPLVKEWLEAHPKEILNPIIR